jgi:hypothetical protein
MIAEPANLVIERCKRSGTAVSYHAVFAEGFVDCEELEDHHGMT